MNNQQKGQASQDSQDHAHREGQQQNIARANNNSQEMPDMMGNREGKGNQVETESERANKNEDNDIRGGNSSV